MQDSKNYKKWFIAAVFGWDFEEEKLQQKKQIKIKTKLNNLYS